MKNFRFDLSLIIPAYNNIENIRRCLDSVFSQRPTGAEVIVIDNASSDSTPEVIIKEYPDVVLMRNKKNMGSSFARNQGIRAARGKYLMFLDSDAYLGKDFFKNLEGVLAGANQPDAISTRILKADSGKVFSCGLRVSALYRVFDVGRGRPREEFSLPLAVDGPNSCCAIFKRECLESLKEKGEYFDEDFFFLFEDADLALRLKEKGHSCLFMPELTCYHYGEGSKLSRDFRRFLSFRNRWYMILKIKETSRLFSFFARSLPYDFLRTLHFSLTNKHFFRCLRDIRKKIKYEKDSNF